jgi:hypothetical protein
MPNILDQLPKGVEVPKRFIRSYNLLSLFVMGWQDGQKGERQYTYGDDFHRHQGRRAIEAYTQGFDAAARQHRAG